MKKSIWENAKKYILPYDGGASQIHILSIPKVEIIHFFQVIAKNVHNAEVTLLSSELLEKNILFTDLTNFHDLSKKIQIGQTTIRAEIFNGSEITFDFWAEK